MVRARAVAPVLALDVAASLRLRPFANLLPAQVARLGGVGPSMLGLPPAAFGAGTVPGGPWMAAADGALARRVACGTALASGCLPVASLTDLPWAFLLAAALLGGAMMVRATAGLTVIQLAAPDAVRGRVSGLYTMAIRGGAALGAAAIGLAATPLGLPAASAAAAIACAVALALARPRLIRPDTAGGGAA